MENQKQQKKKKRFAKRVAVLVVIVIMVLLTRREVVDWDGAYEMDHHPDVTSQAVQLDRLGSGNNGSKVMIQLKTMAISNQKVRKIMRHVNEYPEDILALLTRNEEAINFVLDYPQKSKEPPAQSVGKIKNGEIPELLQWDERWGYQKYGDSIMAISGCGPTALSMVISGLTGNSSITPYKVAEYADQNGYYVNGYGSSWTLMSKGSAAFGVQGQELSLNQNVMSSQLKAGHPIICSMRPGDFTATGHFIVLTGVKNGEFQINDPNSRERSAQLWNYDTLKPQISNLWAFQLKK